MAAEDRSTDEACRRSQCAFLAPEVFTMHGDESLVYDPHAEDEHREKVARAVAACPVQAIIDDARHPSPAPDHRLRQSGEPLPPLREAP
ncbi:ferredoxin [Streptomyces sp. NBC_01353]|uniref:ferredoxin n=1 Tax=Streptomyces sp. NBC_01353 TaxID=2903835 RepID=UPI003DA282DE